MKYATAEKISTQHVYNNEYRVIEIHSDFDSALENAGQQDIVVVVSDEIIAGDSINDNGEKW
jgi:hypothetical protein